jgi:hypothetical protein
MQYKLLSIDTVAYFKVLSQHPPEGTDENYEKPRPNI